MMVPQLRFPEFTDEWQVKKLGDIADFFDGKRVPIDLAARQTMSGEYPYYGASGIIDYVNNYIFDGEYVLLAEDGANILMRSTPIAFIASGKFWLNNHAHIMRSHGSNVFLATYLERLRYDNYNTGTTQPKLNAAIVKTIKVTAPSKPEQEKIAEFLTAVDKRIGVNEKRLEQLQRYKRGVMQKIFSQQIRFKNENGNDYPDWEEKKLGEISTIKTGKKDANIAKKDGQYRFYTCSRDYLHTDVYSFDGEAILVAGNADVGLCHYYDGKFEAYQRTYVLQNFKTDGKFLFKYLSHFLRQYALSLMQTSAMTYITLGTLENFTVPLPIEDEQQEIADFLTAIDEKITAEQTKLTAARQFKKALLQRMFV